jgi:hypothetical protein
VALVGALGTTLTLLGPEGPSTVRATPLPKPSTTPAPAPAGSLPSVAHGDGAYWRFADRMAEQLDAAWDARAGYYRSGRTEPQFNANLLLVHSVAARSGHRGPARDDRRARRLAARLVASPPFVERGARRGGTTQTHMPGWTTAMEGQGVQHLVFDADLVDGLVAAYRARRALRLPPATVRGIADRIHRTVSGPFWRWPAIRLNQINWYALMYAADATVTGDPLRLRRDLRRQIVRFADQARDNFGPGLGFHYLPHRPPATRSNLDSAEYANIVLSFSRFLEQARAAGMKPLPRRATALLRGWARRAVAGYWTHGGYLNWDTGLGFNRWHQTKKLALSQQGLIGVAQSPAIASRRWREWAKWMLDRGFVLFDGWSRRAGGIAPGLAFGVNVRPQSGGDARLAAARMASNAARAVAAGLGSLEARRPPALYAYDPATGRLAVTTPSYNTAVVPVSQGAFPYGGIDLARLYDGSQRVAAGIGGQPPASFGVVVRDVTGRALLATQRPQSALGNGPPVRLTRAPAGVDVAAATAERRAYAGPFRDLRLRGAVTGYGLRADSRYRFTPGFVEARWRIASTTAAPLSTDVLFPSWGAGARVTMMERDGRAVAVGRAPVPLSGAAYLHVQSADSGYVVVVHGVPAGATARLLAPRRQSSAPRAGPTLALQLTRGVRFRRTGLSVRIATARTPAEAAQAATGT